MYNRIINFRSDLWFKCRANYSWMKNNYDDIVCNCNRRVVKALDDAIESSNITALRAILHEFKYSMTMTNYQTGFILASQNNNIEIAKELLKFEVSGHLPRERVVSDAFNICIMRSHLEIASAILDIDMPGHSFYNKHSAMRIATEYGQLDSIKLLLDRTDLQPNYSNNYIIRESAKRGYLSIVKYVSRLPGVNVHDLEYEAYYGALVNNHYEVVDYLDTFPIPGDAGSIPANRTMTKMSTVLSVKPYLYMETEPPAP